MDIVPVESHVHVDDHVFQPGFEILLKVLFQEKEERENIISHTCILDYKIHAKCGEVYSIEINDTVMVLDHNTVEPR